MFGVEDCPSCAVDVKWCVFLFCPSFTAVLSYFFFFTVCVKYIKIVPSVVKKASIIKKKKGKKNFSFYHFFPAVSVYNLEEFIVTEVII